MTNAYKDCNSYYTDYFCTGQHHPYLGNYSLIDGSLAVAEEHGCFWFYDVIISVQMSKRVQKENFQTWFLKRIEGDKFIVFGKNGAYLDKVNDYPKLNRHDNDVNIIFQHLKISYICQVNIDYPYTKA